MLQPKIDIGKRDELIVVQQGTKTKDEYNEDVVTWSTLATVWAAVKDSLGSENYQADQLTAVNITLFDIRYLIGVTEQMMILRNRTSRYYKITGIQRPDRNRSLILRCELLDET